jgi:hypothetical protein
VFLSTEQTNNHKKEEAENTKKHKGKQNSNKTQMENVQSVTT